MIALNYIYGEAAISAAADIKSTFPHIQPGWIAKLTHNKFELLSLANLVGFLYLIYKYSNRKAAVPLTITTLGSAQCYSKGIIFCLSFRPILAIGIVCCQYY